MKTRHGYVSNSSSSSFIIAGDNIDNLKLNISFEVDLKEYLYNNDEYKIKTVEELLEYFKDNYCYDLDDIKNNTNYIKCKKAIENGKTIFMGSFSNQSGDPVEEALCELGIKDNKNNNIEVIFSEGGF